MRRCHCFARVAHSRRSASDAGTSRMVGRMMSEFVFCTGRYESGDWDSAPTLAGESHRFGRALHGDRGRARRGAIVPLASEAILEYPLVYLTGHLPFRFSEAERRNARQTGGARRNDLHRRPQPRHRRRVPQDGDRRDHAHILAAEGSAERLIRSIAPSSSSTTVRRQRVTS